ncbi:hypothetical protein [Actinokineospora terrae]|uniref:Four helix bundle sensory module for signal transduction n=1 Tax=Actinokineospora terrae TaxID=155974 RepID=A0A1H9LA64_9PSEU|nr:hypothetical protein [Actinokineospora terrae]SER08391.1 hypothetical protein SAMN04487818_101526 [Actinokineospora terrae]
MPVLTRWIGRFERRLIAVAAIVVGATVLTAVAVALGLMGQSAVRDRTGLLDDAVGRRIALTGAASDVYRALADADATSLNAVVVGPDGVMAEQERFRKDLFDATDALRVATSLAPEGASDDLVRDLTDLLPEYSRLVEAGWVNAATDQPVGTTYLAQASYLARVTLLPLAGQLHGREMAALYDAQSSAGEPPWDVFAVGAVLLGLLVAAQRYLARTTRQRVNGGLVLSTALVLTALVTLGVAVGLAAGHTKDSVNEFEGVVGPLTEARNLGRTADGDGVRILVFPKVGDIANLRGELAAIEDRVTSAKESGGERLDNATTAVEAWRTEVAQRLEPRNPPLTYVERARLIVRTEHPQRLDEVLTEAITRHTTRATGNTAAAARALAGVDTVFLVCVFGAVLSLGWGMWPPIREQY